MKAISLHQPWASFVADGSKDIETRSWRAHDSVIGERIAIHAAKTRKGQYAFPGVDFDSLAFGCIVATAVIERCVEINHIWSGDYEEPFPSRGYFASERPMSERFEIDDLGDFRRGRYLWILRNVEKLDRPISTPGRQGFWNLPPEIIARIRKQVIA